MEKLASISLDDLMDRNTSTVLSHLLTDEDDEPIRVVLGGRRGKAVYLRRVDPAEADTGSLVLVLSTDEELVVSNHIAHYSIDPGSRFGPPDGPLAVVCVVPAGRRRHWRSR